MDNVITNVESVDTEDGNALFTPAPQKPSDTSQLFPIENMSPKGGYRTFVPFDPMDVYKDNVGPSQMRPITIGEDLDKLKPVTDLRNSIQNAVEPTRAAKVIGLAKATGYDEATVEKHYDDILKTYRFQNIEAENMMFSNPVLFSQLSDRMRTEQAFKDYDQLSTAENLMNVAGTMKKQLVQGWDAGLATVEKGYLNFFDMFGESALSDEQKEEVKQRQYELGKQIIAAELDKYPSAVGYGAGMAVHSLLGGVAGSVAAIAGSMGKTSVAEAIKAGKFGAGVMLFSDSAIIEGGHAYEEAIQRGVPEDDARTIALTVGLINGGLEVAGTVALFSPLAKGAAAVLSPAAKLALKGISRSVGSQLIADMAKKIPTVSTTGREIVGGYLKAIGIEGATEAVQEVVTAIGVDIGAALQKENLEVKLSTEKGRAEIAERAYSAAMTGMMSASALGLFGVATQGAMHGVNTWVLNQQQRISEQSMRRVDDFIQSISSTDQFKNDKEGAAELAQQMGDVHGAPNYSLVVDEFLKSIDNEQLMKNLVDVYGEEKADAIAEELTAAVDERRDAVIPVKDLVMAIDTPLEEHLKNHIRMDARGLTKDQSETFKQLIPEYKQIESAYMAEDEQRAMTQEEAKARTFIELYKSLGGDVKVVPQTFVGENGEAQQRSINSLNDEDVAKLDMPNFGGEQRIALASMMSNFYDYMAKNSTVDGTTAYDVFQNAPVRFVSDAKRTVNAEGAVGVATQERTVNDVVDAVMQDGEVAKSIEREMAKPDGDVIGAIDKLAEKLDAAIETELQPKQQPMVSPLDSDTIASYLGDQGYQMSGNIFYNTNTDFASFVHEVSHHFLRSMMIHSMLHGPNNSIAADVETLIDNFVGKEDDVSTVMRDPEKYRLLQEQFAYNWQLYVFKGESYRKQTSSKLRQIFDAFSLFIKHSYEVARRAAQKIFKREYGVDLRPATDETKLVFDRIMSGDSLYEIGRSVNKQGSTFRTAEEGGMTQEEWSQYVSTELYAKRKAQADWIADILSNMPTLAGKFTQSSKGKSYAIKTSDQTIKAIDEMVENVVDTYNALKVEIETFVDEMPVFKNQAAIRALPADQRPNLADVLTLYGPDIIGKPSYHDLSEMFKDGDVFSRDEEANIETIAKNHGFASGEELVGLWLAPPNNGSYTSAFATKQADAMTAYGKIKADIAAKKHGKLNIALIESKMAPSLSSTRYSLLWSGEAKAIATENGLPADAVANMLGYVDAKAMFDEFLKYPTRDEFVAYATRKKMETLSGAFSNAHIQSLISSYMSSDASVDRVISKAARLFKNSQSGPDAQAIFESVDQTARNKIESSVMKEAMDYREFEARAASFGLIADSLITKAKVASQRGNFDEYKQLMAEAGKAAIDQAVYVRTASMALALSKQVVSMGRNVRNIMQRFNRSKRYAATHAQEYLNGLSALYYLTGLGVGTFNPVTALEDGQVYLDRIDDSSQSDPGMAVDVKAIIGPWATVPKHYEAMAYSEYQQLSNAFKQLHRQSIDALKIKLHDQAVERDKVVDELLDTVNADKSAPIGIRLRDSTGAEHTTVNKAQNVPALVVEEKKLKPWLQRPAYLWEEIGKKVTELHTYMLRATYIAKELDLTSKGIKVSDSTHDGPWMKYIIRPVMSGLDAYRKDKEVAIGELVKIIRRFDFTGDNVTMSFKRDNNTPVEMRSVTRAFTRGELYSMLLHLGNESNMRKLIVGYNWHAMKAHKKIMPDGSVDISYSLPEDYFKHVLAFVQEQINRGVITLEDMNNIQEMWDNLENLSHGFRRAYKEATGIVWDKIPRKKLTFVFNGQPVTFEGGYVPATTNKDIVNDIDIKQVLHSYDIDLGTASQSAPSGAAKERQLAYNRPLLLDMTAQLQHVDDVLRYTYLQVPVKNAVKILLDPRIKRYFSERGDMLLDKVFLPWLTRAIRQITIQKSDAPAYVDAALNKTRMRASGVVMFLNFINAAQQILGVSPAMLMVKKSFVKQSTMTVLKNYTASKQFMISSSSFMKQRVDNQFTDMAEEIKLLVQDAGMYANLQMAFKKQVYVLQTLMQNWIDTIVWHSAYNQHMAELATQYTNPAEAHDDAVQKANEIVRMTQSSLNAEDISAVEIGNPLWKWFMMFHNWFNAMYNLNRLNYVNIHKNMGGLLKNLPHTMFIFTVGFAIPFIVGDYMSRLFSAGKAIEDEDDDDFIVDDFFFYFVKSAIRGLTAMVPFGPAVYSGLIDREIFAGKEGGVQYQGDRLMSNPSTSMLISASNGIWALVDLAIGDKEELKGRDVRKVCQAFALMTGLYLNPACKSAGFAIDEGDKFEGMDFALGLASGRVNR